ncbi:hypothetical protein [Photobacterium alginatilyticum]|uniref:DUF3899 domain-containing protein n=1 Tax=Photobacterium alginatilyticum TaxID=1775171 RepID=A0ABW9YE47_9GAMM|nr:hypothetical protein [Photobacterium alginatilyticum]NBI52049.1 hypothetical protein [Photobacterium alginatilyticum]
MLRLIKFMLVANIIAILSVWLLSQLIVQFSINHPTDYLFYICIVLWGIAGLTWDGGKKSKNYDLDRAERKIQSMVSGYDVKADKHQQYRENYHFGLKMFISGLPSLLGCIIVSLL